MKLTGFKDGIVNPFFYEKARVKMLWILKEVNHDGEIDDWNMSEILQNIKTEYGIESGWEKTFAPIIYSSYGIIHQKKWDEIPYCSHKPELVDILKEIAFINVKKTSGDSSTHYSILDKAYLENKEFLFSQINDIKPDVIIYGGTYYLFKNDLDRYLHDKNIVHIDAYHPAQRTITQEKYCNQIIDTAINLNQTK